MAFLMVRPAVRWLRCVSRPGRGVAGLGCAPAGLTACESRCIAAHLLARRVQPPAGVDDEVGPRALLGVGHLPRQDGVELAPASCPAGPAPARAAPRPAPMTTTTASIVVVAAGLEQQRHVEHHHVGARRLAPRSKKPARSAATSGWTIASSRFSAAGIAEHPLAQRLAVDRARPPPRPGTAASTGPTAAPPCAIERVHRGVGVVDRHARLARTCAAVVDLPMPIEPVRPTTIIRSPSASRPEPRTSTPSGGGAAEEGLERGSRLADQHGQAVDRAPARAPAPPARSGVRSGL